VIAALIATGLMAGVFGGWLREPEAPKKRPAALTQPVSPRASPTPQAERRPVSVVFVPTRAPAA